MIILSIVVESAIDSSPQPGSMLKTSGIHETYLANQYIAAEPSDPLKHLCSAEIMSYLSSPLLSYPFLSPRRTVSISS